jgi:hypothetical protein
VIGILGAVVWLFWRRRKDVGTSGELGIPELGNRRLRHEMAAPHGHQELGVERIRHEMAAPHGQQELEVKRHPPRIYEMAAQP